MSGYVSACFAAPFNLQSFKSFWSRPLQKTLLGIAFQTSAVKLVKLDSVWLPHIFSAFPRYRLHISRYWQWHLSDKPKWLLHGHSRCRVLASTGREPHWPPVFHAELILCLLRLCHHPSHHLLGHEEWAHSSADTRNTGHSIFLQDMNQWGRKCDCRIKAIKYTWLTSTCQRKGKTRKGNFTCLHIPPLFAWQVEVVGEAGSFCERDSCQHFYRYHDESVYLWNEKLDWWKISPN